MPEYEVVIGLETHIQLNTKSKIFCGCKADSWEEEPNTNICPVCSGLPGTLPVLNKVVVEKAVLLAKAMNSEIRGESFFDRKNYFYPDLPKGYQITQFDQSIAFGGYIDLPMDGYVRRVTIEKLHLEEDAGKTKHNGGNWMVDFNRCGVPLVEMVTAPDLRTADEAAEYLKRLRQILKWLNISEANMEKAHLRADANVSIRLKGEDILNTKTEIKNVNSIEAVRTAINVEAKRQIKEVEAGREIKPWTLDWDEDTQTVKKMRSKETEADYRYFKEPDLMRVQLNDEWKGEILTDFPELPLARRVRFIKEYNIPENHAEFVTHDKAFSEFFSKAADIYGKDSKRVSNWMLNGVMMVMNLDNKKIGELKLTPEYLVDIIKLLDKGIINTTTAKSLLIKIEATGKSPKDIVEEEGLAQVSDVGALKELAKKLVEENPDQVKKFRGGKESLIGWFVGQIMRQTQGKADPEAARKVLLEQLKE
jgi:aspartyl-tRNA(Asn)/glutamyl-tRNA(Gln) amidotransferase subunit B